jgi:hypothetical protein
MLLLGLLTLASAPPDPGIHSSWSWRFGGEARERYESSDNPVFGLDSPTQNDYLLQRLMLNADLRYAQKFRVFAELVSGLTAGWSGPPSPLQDDSLDLLQGFVEFSQPAGQGKATVSAGRQEMHLGSSRLVSTRESPNIRRAFDGVKASWSDDSRRVDAFYMRPVLPETGSFNDRSTSAQSLWGVYASFPVRGVSGLSLDTYYLGFDKQVAKYSQGIGHELRHSIGVRAFGERAEFDWNLEAVWQWGSFASDNIRAWTASADIGYTFEDVRFRPRLGLKADAISGDDNLADHTLETFNPLFPKLPYFSEANLATPANLLDLQPSLQLSLPHAVELHWSWNPLWKFARADAFYAPPLQPVAGTARTPHRDVGWQMSGTIEWHASHSVALGGTYVGYSPGSVTEDAGGRSGSFLAAWVQVTF